MDVDNNRTIIIFTTPSGSHLNPTLSFVNQLMNKLDDMNIKKLIIYTEPEFYERILNIPNNQNQIEVRSYNLEKYVGHTNLLKVFMDFDTKAGSLFRCFRCFENAFKLIVNQLGNMLVDVIYNEKPVLIIYDQALIFMKLVFSLYAKKYKCDKPMSICYVTTFMFVKGIYPNMSELYLMGITKSLKNIFITLFDLLHYIIFYYKLLLWDLDFSIKEILSLCQTPMANDFLINDKLTLVFILPELQPHVELFRPLKTILFLGSSIDEKVRSTMIVDKFSSEKSMEFVNQYLDAQLTNGYVKNGLVTSGSKKPLIYVSIGTTFNIENGDLFELLIETCKCFSNHYAIVMSTGNDVLYFKYMNKCKESNILLLPHVPQIEILKRTHLFLTHAGMNSISEALHFGCPIVCIPLHGDQPLIAWRIANEMQMGIRLLSEENLTIDKLHNALNEVLTNPKYRQRAEELSIISQRYNGHIRASELIVEFIQQRKL